MNVPLALDWTALNQLALGEAVERLRLRIEAYAVTGAPSPAPDNEPAFPALDHLAHRFGLSAFERNVLLLACGNELSAGFAQTLAQAQGGHAEPTFSLALAALAEGHWSALAPASPLRRWLLIELIGDGGLALRGLRADERVLHHLAGLNQMDVRLIDRVGLHAPGTALTPTQAQLAQRIARGWARAPALLVMHGGHGTDRAALAAAVARELGFTPCSVTLAALGTETAERTAFFVLWNREAALGQGALCIECPPDAAGTSRDSEIAALEGALAACPGLVMLSADAPPRLPRCSARVFEVPAPLPHEQALLWRERLGSLADTLAADIERAARCFQLGPRQIDAVCARLADCADDTDADADAGVAVAVSAGTATARSAIAADLWTASREVSRVGLDELAQRVESPCGWDDLVLPPAERATLCLIASHVRQQAKVFGDWGFAGRSSRGQGLSALFAGPSGTGKTLAAEVLANELQLDLYRIDLAGLVSKYIGETEKNLKRVFDAAQASGAILLFDEADALFGKRSEVKDSHDRYANIEVGYLLQRMESYRGLAILTTNLKHSLDSAFLRRIRFIVNFPYPGVTERIEIWRRVFPSQTPREDLNIERLAQLNLAGGNIQNIALGAAFLAAEAGRPVTMAHLLEAARSECRKLDHPLTDVEVRGWT